MSFKYFILGRPVTFHEIVVFETNGTCSTINEQTGSMQIYFKKMSKIMLFVKLFVKLFYPDIKFKIPEIKSSDYSISFTVEWKKDTCWSSRTDAKAM